MENNKGTVTIPLETYQDMEELIKNQDERINELANAHSVFIDRRNPTGKIIRFGTTREHTWYDLTTFQIKGSLTETNEAIQALRNELDQIHEQGNKREAQYVETIAALKRDITQRDIALKNLNRGKLETIVDKFIKPKKWYQF
jgi:hypothetical protein